MVENRPRARAQQAVRLGQTGDGGGMSGQDQTAPGGQTRKRERSVRSATTLKHVADAAGVSTATVSRCLNQPDAVRPHLRRAVFDAVERLGYTPHAAARALVAQRTLAIGAVVPTIDNAIFAAGIHALQQRLSDAGYTLLLASSDYDEEREYHQICNLLTRGVDGLMLIGAEHDTRAYKRIQALGVPYVNTWVYAPESPHPSIGFNNREASRRLVSYLLEMGHQRIAMVAGVTRGNDRASARIAGVRDGLAAQGLAPNEAWFIERPYSIEEGRNAARSLLSAPGDERPTAIICGNDVLAFGVLFECAAMGVAVPGAVSVVGFDDLDLARHVAPGLTTMRVPSEAMGARAADYLLARIREEAVPNSAEMEVSLIVRGSTGPPPR